MYSTRHGYVLGFHGCDRSVATQVIQGRDVLRISENDYDWLGHGVYFWEASYSRAMEFAEFRKRNPRDGSAAIKEPTVIGAVIALGLCLDLLDADSLSQVETAYDSYSSLVRESGWELPQNTSGSDLRLRRLDCAVVEYLHSSLDSTDEKYYDSVRGMFTEGISLYPGAGFHRKDHIQLCVRNPNCIKGYFDPRVHDSRYRKI